MDVTILLVETLLLPQPGLEHATHAEMRRWWKTFFDMNDAASVRQHLLRSVAGT